MASDSSTRQSNRLRTRRQRFRTVDADDDVLVAGTSAPTANACIDLTTDTSNEDIIDLTHAQNTGLMDLPVVVLTPFDHTGPIRSRMGSGRLGRHRSRANRRRLGMGQILDLSLSPTRAPVYVLPSDDSDNDLPDPAAEDPSLSSSSSILQSPEGVKITCPICMDDIRQIRRNHRKLMSTNCGHIFCNVCIEVAISTQHTCPTCRKRLTARSVHPLFV